MKVCVFCGSSSGNRSVYAKFADDLGALLAGRGIELIYGGGKVGLMGVIADAALSAGGRVTGIMPRALAERELSHPGITNLIIVETMHQRKTQMSNLADAFIALPGGAGTLEELFEQWTWAQLGIHRKPIGVLNVDGYFDSLSQMIARIVADGFMNRDYGDMLIFSANLEAILDAFSRYSPPPQKWIRAIEPGPCQ